jgi:adenylate cyclase
MQSNPPLEIEKKYLVLNDDWKKEVSNSFTIYQGYYTENEQFKRIRLVPEEGTAIVAYKEDAGEIKGFVKRIEIENAVDYQTGLDLIKNSRSVIVKQRHLIPFGEYTIELDVFSNLDKPLVMAEIEVQENQIDSYLTKKLPSWLGEDVSNSKSHTNARLSDNALPIDFTSLSKITTSKIKP